MSLIKVCGNRYAADAHMVASFQPDFMGWIFVPSSPRLITPEEASEFISGIRADYPDIQHVAVMGGMEPEKLVQLLRRFSEINNARFPVDAIQLIGTSQEIQGVASSLQQMGADVPIWPVLRVDGPVNDQDLLALAQADMYLLDRKVSNALGGTGRTIDEEWIQAITLPYLLAGGINHLNALEKLKTTSARGVDIASGLEDGRPGHKDEAKLKALFDSLNRI